MQSSGAGSVHARHGPATPAHAVMMVCVAGCRRSRRLLLLLLLMLPLLLLLLLLPLLL